MMRREEVARYVPAAQLDAACIVLASADTYASVSAFVDGWPVAGYQLEAARELVRVGLLAEVAPFRFKLAPSRDIGVL